ncbi:MAG: hypothetical protein AAGC81_03440 [Pseudomonadota bacterium]
MSKDPKDPPAKDLTDNDLDAAAGGGTTSLSTGDDGEPISAAGGGGGGKASMPNLSMIKYTDSGIRRFTGREEKD